MKTLIVAIMAVAVNSAQADGFICQDYKGSLNVKVFHHTAPHKGTRTAAKMIISDPRVSAGRKTIATFDSVDGLLTSRELSYVADVDLRYSESSRKGENIGGTKLGELEAIELLVDFSYAQPTRDGEETDALLRLEKRDGRIYEIDMVCERYLKLK